MSTKRGKDAMDGGGIDGRAEATNDVGRSEAWCASKVMARRLSMSRGANHSKRRHRSNRVRSKDATASGEAERIADRGFPTQTTRAAFLRARWQEFSARPRHVGVDFVAREAGLCLRHRTTAPPCRLTCLPRTPRMATVSFTSVGRMWVPYPQGYRPDGCGSRIRVDGCEGDGFDPSEDRAVSTRGDAAKARPRPHVQARVPRQKRGRT